ncbi:hypothetical protein Y032_0515g2787 [Ancylostoma ceylanicum]|uniref:Uncharacterized protein n=1 Tax=Ancylostoma ceylanicum TaxID=53326 RepID=A0A016WSP8_9BILA|nr:hypothetical protein Y032_0515g2787 [Ancylostoma ceylanicum]
MLGKSCTSFSAPACLPPEALQPLSVTSIQLCRHNSRKTRRIWTVEARLEGGPVLCYNEPSTDSMEETSTIFRLLRLLFYTPY